MVGAVTLRLGPYPHFDGQLAIHDTPVTGIWQDSLGVQTVRRYALTRPD